MHAVAVEDVVGMYERSSLGSRALLSVYSAH